MLVRSLRRGYALISQDEVPYGDIMLEDLWPGIAEFEQVNVRIDMKKKLQSQSNDEEETGSAQFAKKRAEKLRIKEEKESIALENGRRQNCSRSKCSE